MAKSDINSYKKLSIKEAVSKFNTNISNGLDDNEVKKRVKKYGLNEIEEKEVSFFHLAIKEFYGPIPFMIELAAILSAFLGKWNDFFIISFLLITNSGISLWQEAKAMNALKVLKNKLARRALVLRNGKFKEINAKNLVPGDIIKLKIGDIIPSDVKIVEMEELEIDQSVLTGESLPVFKKKGDVAYGNSIVKKGEATAIVIGTGHNTYFGKTVSLVANAEKGNQSHLQKAVIEIGRYLIIVAVSLGALIFVVSLLRHQPILEILRYVLVLTIASIPVAMPAILSVTLAVGAIKLSKKQAIVSKLASIEELAGIDTLCFDKTGTLTQNKMSLSTPTPFGKFKVRDLMIYAGLASSEEEHDPIETPIFSFLEKSNLYRHLKSFKKIKFKPFNPVDKRTEAIVLKGSKRLIVTKGATEVILKLSKVTSVQKKEIEKEIEKFSNKGMRTLGVAVKRGKDYAFVGIIPMFDPPREDSKRVLADAKKLGLNLKMLTGDNALIAKYISNLVGIGKKVLDSRTLESKWNFSSVSTKSQNLKISPEMSKEIDDANGFAGVYPKDKYIIISSLQKENRIVGMTGDGVNDAPALSKADCGIAVSGATDAARASADLILMNKGLSVIVGAIKDARKIFLRMKSYSTYRIAETIRLLFFIAASILILGFYPITPLMIILILVFNDIPILAIAYDNTRIENSPVRWDLKEVLTIATGIGIFGVMASFFSTLFDRYCL